MYQIKEREPFVIKGKKGKEYKIPMYYHTGIGVDELKKVFDIYQTQDLAEKVRLSKEFLLALVPELEEEDIGAFEYWKIFEAYDNAHTDKQRKKLGES